MSLALLGFDLLRPAWALALVVAPCVLVVALVGLAARARARAKLVSARHAPRFLPRYSENRARLRVVFAVAALGFLALGLIGPVRGYTLRDVQRKAKQVIWLNPENKTTWGFGDSEMDRYMAFCDVVEECRNLNQLYRVVDRLVLS